MSQEELEKLIYVKHPNKQIRQNQIEALEKSPVDQFGFVVQLWKCVVSLYEPCKGRGDNGGL